MASCEWLVATKMKEPREMIAGLFPYLLGTNHSPLATYFKRTSDIAMPFDCVLQLTEPTWPAATLKRT